MVEVPEHPKILRGFISVLGLLTSQEALPKYLVHDFFFFFFLLSVIS